MPSHHRPRHARRMSRTSCQDPERVDEGQAGRLHQEHAQQGFAPRAVADRLRGPNHRRRRDLRHPELIRLYFDPHTTRRCWNIYN